MQRLGDCLYLRKGVNWRGRLLRLQQLGKGHQYIVGGQGGQNSNYQIQALGGVNANASIGWQVKFVQIQSHLIDPGE